MKSIINLLPAAKCLAVLLVFTLIPSGVQAAAIFTLEGEVTGVKYEDNSDIRISLIDWSEENAQAAVEDSWRHYQEGGELADFMATVEAQDTLGYIFTAAATGYSIKYAWKEDTMDGETMHLLVIPGLKTRNPYLWVTPNNDSPEFTLVQVNMGNDTGEVRSSLAGEISLKEGSGLVLKSFDSQDLFATVKDNTPYYLKQ